MSSTSGVSLLLNQSYSLFLFVRFTLSLRFAILNSPLLTAHLKPGTQFCTRNRWPFLRIAVAINLLDTLFLWFLALHNIMQTPTHSTAIFGLDFPSSSETLNTGRQSFFEKSYHHIWWLLPKFNAAWLCNPIHSPHLQSIPEVVAFTYFRLSIHRMMNRNFCYNICLSSRFPRLRVPCTMFLQFITLHCPIYEGKKIWRHC